MRGQVKPVDGGRAALAGCLPPLERLQLGRAERLTVEPKVGEVAAEVGGGERATEGSGLPANAQGLEPASQVSAGDAGGFLHAVQPQDVGSAVVGQGDVVPTGRDGRYIGSDHRHRHAGDADLSAESVLQLPESEVARLRGNCLGVGGGHAPVRAAYAQRDGERRGVDAGKVRRDGELFRRELRRTIRRRARSGGVSEGKPLTRDDVVTQDSL